VVLAVVELLVPAVAAVVVFVTADFVAATLDAELLAAFSAKPPVSPATAATLAIRVARRAPLAA
jgi:hypothetical protein